MSQLSFFKIEPGKNLLPHDGEALFYPEFLNEKESRLYFQHIKKSFEFSQEQVKMYDRYVDYPRLTAVCGEPYRSNSNPDKLIEPQAWTAPIMDLKSSIEKIVSKKFTHALFNLYRDGNDHVSWHRDKERFQGDQTLIASLSLGATRIFQFRHFADKKLTREVELVSGSMVIMQGEIQNNWEHRIPKTTKRIGERINITFRIGAR